MDRVSSGSDVAHAIAEAGGVAKQASPDGARLAHPSGEAAAEGAPLRVLFINDTARNGGPGRSLYYILRFLDTRVVRKSVLLPREGVIGELLSSPGAADEVFYEPGLVENPVEPWDRAMTRQDFDAPLGLRLVRFVGNVVRAVAGARRVVRLLRDIGAQLLYCNGTNACFAGGVLSRVTGVPALWHVRYTSVPPLLRPLHDKLAASRGVARIVCVSGASAALFPHCAGKVRVIHNALDFREFDSTRVPRALRHELGLDDGAVIFVSHGRVLPRKGFSLLVRAARVALDALPEGDRGRFHVAVVGDTPEDIRPDHLAECKALAHDVGVEGAVHFLGFKSDVRPYVADADVSVVPSVYPDPLPRAVIESMALGKAVVAFDVGGVREMLVPGETGALLSASEVTAEALARELVRYFHDRELRVRQGEAGRRRVEVAFDARTQALAIQSQIVAAAGQVP